MLWEVSKEVNLAVSHLRNSNSVFLLRSSVVSSGIPTVNSFRAVKCSMPSIDVMDVFVTRMSFTAAISSAERKSLSSLSNLSLTYCRKPSSGKFVSSIATSSAAKAAVGSSVSTMQQSSRMLRSLFLIILFLRFLCNRLIWSLQFFCSLTRLLRPPPFSCGTLPQQQNGDSVASLCPLPTA